MKLKDRYLVVARIISGKGFPNRNGYEIMAEAKFNGHVLSIDSVAHTDNPLFEQELGWELDKKSLHQHKLQRSCLKIQFFAINRQSPVKEFLGYILMDLRSISTNQTHKYQTLLHSKYQTKPEILCGIYLDEDGQEIVNDNQSMDPITDVKLLKPKFVPEMNNNAAYYQIGPDKLCKNGFLLTITILEANNLTFLIPTDIPISKTGENKFYFYYDLFGNSILSEKFTDLVKLTFGSERTSVNILSSVDLLKMFFNNLKFLSLQLCCNNHSLGITDVPIHNLMDDIDHQFQSMAVLEQTYQLHNPNKVSRLTKKPSEGGTGAGNDYPTVKISITLHRVNDFEKMQSCPQTGIGSESNHNPRNQQRNMNNTVVNSSPTKNVTMQASPDVRYTHQIHGEQKRHLCYTIELRSIRKMMNADHTKRIYTRYVYPIFGSAAPIMTHPPIEIRREQEVLLPQGYCAFEFGAAWRLLENKLEANPLVVEVFERDKIKDNDQCIGIVTLHLNQVLSAANSRTQHRGHLCLRYNGVAEIKSIEKTVGDSVGELVYNLSIEDFGPIKSSIDQNVEDIKTTRTRTSSNNNEPANNRETQEYQLALELEIWKENEQAEFMKQLKEKESQTMLSLAEEWKKRDKEREIIVKKKITEYEELEKALRTTLVNLSERERQLAAGENELKRLKTELESEANRRANEICDAGRRLEKDCEHKAQLLAENVDHWKSMAHEWQQKAQQVEREFSKYRSDQTRVPETRLQFELNSVQAEKLKLEEALDMAHKAKDNYKKQWVRAINEVARLKQKNEKLSKDNIKKQELNMDELKMKYKTIDSATGTSSQLETIKMELDKLRDEAHTMGSLDGAGNGHMSQNWTNMDLDKLDEESANKVIRLIEERDMLLKTGLYSSHDPVIGELDKELRKMMDPSALATVNYN